MGLPSICSTFTRRGYSIRDRLPLTFFKFIKVEVGFSEWSQVNDFVRVIDRMKYSGAYQVDSLTLIVSSANEDEYEEIESYLEEFFQFHSIENINK